MAKLTGNWLRVYRWARALGVFRLYAWLYTILRGYPCYIPWFDPFDAGHIGFAMAERIAEDDRDHIEIASHEFDQWLNADTRTTPGYDRQDCFDRLVCELRGVDQTSWLSGEAGVHYLFQSSESGQILVDVLWRRRTMPPITRGQHY
jgi:hypothetical protein